MTIKYSVRITGCGSAEEIAESLRNIADDVLERGIEDTIIYEDATLYSQLHETDEDDEEDA